MPPKVQKKKEKKNFETASKNLNETASKNLNDNVNSKSKYEMHKNEQGRKKSDTNLKLSQKDIVVNNKPNVTNNKGSKFEQVKKNSITNTQIAQNDKLINNKKNELRNKTPLNSNTNKNISKTDQVTNDTGIVETKSLFKYQNIKKISHMRPLSLRNFGATCYLNSAFQGISACGTFCKDIYALSDKYKEVNELQVFKSLIEVLNGCSRTDMDISQNKIFCNWNKSGQQDSYELLAYALNQVYNKIRNYKEKKRQIRVRDLEKWLQERLPLRLLLQYKIVCKCSLVTYSPLQSDLALHVTIPRKGEVFDLKELIDKYFEEDPILDYSCDRPNCDGKGTKRLVKLVKPLSRSICIHLQRTFWNGSEMKKINKKVTFPPQLNIKSAFCTKTLDESISVPNDKNGENFIVKSVEKESSIINANNKNSLDGKNFVKGGQSEIETHMTKNNSNHSSEKGKIKTRKISTNTMKPNKKPEHLNGYPETKVKRKLNKSSDELVEFKCLKLDEKKEGLNSGNSDEIYYLASVIEHSGTVQGGHYICYKKVDDQWFETNDSFVCEVTQSEVLNCQAYILFYEQAEKVCA